MIIVKEDCTEAGKPGEVSAENSQVNVVIISPQTNPYL